MAEDQTKLPHGGLGTEGNLPGLTHLAQLLELALLDVVHDRGIAVLLWNQTQLAAGLPQQDSKLRQGEPLVKALAVLGELGNALPLAALVVRLHHFDGC